MHPLALARRRLVTAATIGAGLTLFPALPAAAGPRDAGPVLRLPAPTGPHPIGTVPLHLVDPSRTDPWVTPTRPGIGSTLLDVVSPRNPEIRFVA